MILRPASLVLLATVAWAADCSRTSTSLMPLNAPFFRAYKGMPGGLYPNNSNTRPAAHEAAGIALVKQVRPRNASGQIDEQNGRIVMLSIGMSNTTQEFSAFKALADRDPDRNPRLAIVDGAQGSYSADHILADSATYFNNIEQRLAAARVTDAQVEAAWVKLADSNPTLPFPDDARKLESETQTIIQMAIGHYPNLRLVYLSSRIYAGYATTNLNPEPYAYQGGFSVKWLIEQQIQGSADLSYQAGKFPWLAWGPYLWADGTSARWDGLAWNCADLADDGTHPSPLGQGKVARMLLDFFKGDTTARPWFTAPPASAPPAPAIASMVNAASFMPTAATGGIASIFGTNLAGTTALAPAIPLPFGLAGVTVTVGGELAPLYYVSPTQINLVVPPQLSDTTVVVTRDGLASAGFTAQVNAIMSVEGLFTLGGSGQGAAAALHADGTVVSSAAPARPGETIEIFGTGKGVPNPMILIPVVLPVVQVGGVRADLQYYGAAPGWPGLDQINITVPADAPTGAAVPLNFQAGSFPANTVTLAVAAGP